MKNYILFLLFVLSSCGQSCKELPSSYKNYEEAKTIVLSTDFKFTDDCDTSESSFITSADYYSCDRLTGYFIVGMNDKNTFSRICLMKFGRVLKMQNLKVNFIIGRLEDVIGWV